MGDGWERMSAGGDLERERERGNGEECCWPLRAAIHGATSRADGQQCPTQLLLYFFWLLITSLTFFAHYIATCITTLARKPISEWPTHLPLWKSVTWGSVKCVFVFAKSRLRPNLHLVLTCNLSLDNNISSLAFAFINKRSCYLNFADFVIGSQ